MHGFQPLILCSCNSALGNVANIKRQMHAKQNTLKERQLSYKQRKAPASDLLLELLELLLPFPYALIVLLLALVNGLLQCNLSHSSHG